VAANSNTIIQILRSYANTAPLSLQDGELAYSFVSNTMFIGNNTNDVIRIGGEYYVKAIETATREDIANTIVLRDENGSANVILDFIDGGGF
jgi:hypothetical protein